jgi:hypothetical protein
MCKLSEILTKGLQTYAKKKSENELGDRSAYIGASDIPNCPRKVILDKLDSDDHDLETLVRFERGHLAEDIVAKALQSAGYGNFVRQYEVDASEVLGVPIKAHLDFVWFSPNSLSVLEVKTVSSIPDFPYESWEMQLYAQMGLLVLTGIKVPVRGAILALDLNSGQHKVFNGYEHNEEVARGLIERGVFLWEALQAIKMERAEGELETEISNLCAYCKHIATCPRFAGPEIPELEPLASQLQSLRNQQKELKKQADSVYPCRKQD